MKTVLPTIAALAALPFLSPWAERVQDEEPSEISQILRQLYEDDQAMRAGWSSSQGVTPEQIAEMHRSDEERRGEVLAILADGLVETGADHYHAAMILQHGGQPEDYLLSHILATVAGFEGHTSARWLAAASLDRYLQSIDRPQVFGTQYGRGAADTAWTQEPIDGALITDVTRGRYNVPGLAAAAERLEDYNR